MSGRLLDLNSFTYPSIYHCLLKKPSEYIRIRISDKIPTRREIKVVHTVNLVLVCSV